MVLFQHEDSPRHAIAATQTAAALLNETKTLNALSKGPPLQLHMGINSGIASLGSTRFDGLHGSRWVFTADGFVPNLAARLAEVAKPNEVLVGPETASYLRSRFRLKRMRSRYLRNISDRVEVFSVVSLLQDLEALKQTAGKKSFGSVA